MKNTVNSTANTNNDPIDDDTVATLDSRFNQTLKSVQGMLKGRSFPGKVLLTRRTEPFDASGINGSPREYMRSFSQNDVGPSEQGDKSEQSPSTDDSDSNAALSKSKSSDSPFNTSKDSQKTLLSARATDSARVVRAIRHPASGYVQGINDLVTPFLVVFLSEHLEGNVDTWSTLDLPEDIIANVEADCYWCLSKLLDGMQDHYTFAQPGIQRLVFKLRELVRRIDEPVSRHMEEQGLEFLQFAFRWFNCLLIREIPFPLVTRLWDTYLAEGDALPDFLVYIAARDGNVPSTPTNPQLDRPRIRDGAFKSIYVAYH
ncbi:TBC1 domain family member 22A, partial [Bienertia sinuspersici]